MAITVNLRYSGTDGSARLFAKEMISSGTVDKIHAEKGNLRYEYYMSLDDPTSNSRTECFGLRKECDRDGRVCSTVRKEVKGLLH